MLCDAELAAQRPDDALTGVLDPAAGTARHALLAIAADDRTARDAPAAGLRPRPALRAADAELLLEALRAAAEERFALPEWEAEPDGLLISLRSSGAEWMPRAWVELATRLLIEGTTTRAGRHPRAARRGLELPAAERARRPHRGHHRRLACSRCAAARCGSTRPTRRRWPPTGTSSASRPTSSRGSADYERFVRKHLHLFAPAEDGEVEAGPSHVHPELGPFAPPPIERFGALNAELVARAADRDAARERWQIGTPYRGVELPTLLVRRSRRRRSRRPRRREAKRPPELSQRVPIASGLGGAAAFGALGVATGAPALLAGLALAPAGLAWAAVRLREAKRRMPLVLPLDAAARAVADAYRELGELSAGGRRVAADRAARRRLPALRAGRGARPTRASASPPRSTSW